MITKSLTRYILVEGETEHHFFSEFKNYGKLHKFNPFTQYAKRIIPNFTRNKHNEVILICDTDVKEPNESLFRENISLIKQNAKKLIVVSQKHNFEDELAYCLGISPQSLYKKFNCKSKNDFKRDFCQITNLKSTLNGKNFDLQKYCSRSYTNILLDSICLDHIMTAPQIKDFFNY